MPHNETIKLLLVDDHPFVVAGIRACLRSRSNLLVVGEAANGKEALEKSIALSPSVVVMDASMPVMDGLEATRRLRFTVPEAKVLILTVHEKKEFVARIVEAGAKGYVCKSSSPSELVAAIERVHHGQLSFKFSSPLEVTRPLPTGGVPVKSEGAELSLREREVLTLIAEGFSNKQTASLLGVSVRTVEKHREGIMGKLNFHSVVQLTKYAIAQGLVQVGHSASEIPAAS